MIEKSEVIEFFDRCAPYWDSNMVRKEEIISRILDNGGVRKGVNVLDVACGTGVLFPDYISRKVNSVTGIDISPEMAKIAAEKFPGENVRVICGDVEEYCFDRKFDVVMVYNAFPHFPEPQRLIKALAAALKEGGRLSIAHSMSREQLHHHHSGPASKVSIGLLHEDELAALLKPCFDVDVIISNDDMYQVSGIKNEQYSSYPT